MHSRKLPRVQIEKLDEIHLKVFFKDYSKGFATRGLNVNKNSYHFWQSVSMSYYRVISLAKDIFNGEWLETV